MLKSFNEKSQEKATLGYRLDTRPVQPRGQHRGADGCLGQPAYGRGGALQRAEEGQGVQRTEMHVSCFIK